MSTSRLVDTADSKSNAYLNAFKIVAYTIEMATLLYVSTNTIIIYIYIYKLWWMGITR